MPGKAPHGCACAEVLFEIAGPQHYAFLGVQAEQISLRAEGVDLASADQWRRARSRRVTHGVGAVVGVLPDEFAIRLVQAEHSLVSGNLAAVESATRHRRSGVNFAIHQVDAAARD